MSEWTLWFPPVASFVFLVLFASVLWVTYSKREKYQDGIKEHSERIYRDFEFFVKIFIALVGAVGYLRLKEFDAAPILARQAMKAIGLLGLLTMTTLALFVICHQGSKIRRWKKVEWDTIIFWQEIWMILSMFVMATALWIAAWRW
jgi:Na+/H+ antiporter NhaD/arsenite permease-like protein